MPHSLNQLDPPLWPDPIQADTNPRPPLHCGLGQADRTILEAHLDAGTIRPELIWWNQIVGTIPHWAAEIADPRRREWIERAYCKRPDIVWFEAEAIHVAEIKPYASYVAYGQACIYGRLAAARLWPPRELRVWIITDVPDPDLVACLTPDCPRILELDEHVVPRPSRIT